MDGDFKGDFSRDSFNVLQVFSRVLMQQGRVQLDADWNEQADSLLYYLRTLASNIIGPMGGRDPAFQIDHIRDAGGTAQDAKDFTIHAGHYYVDGILCANDAVDEKGDPIPFIKYTGPPYKPDRQDLSGLANGQYLVYLDVWERQVTALENDSIYEVALGPGGPDTATRGEIVWQIRVISLDTVIQAIEDTHSPDLFTIVDKLRKGTSMTVSELREVKDVLTEHFQSKNRGQITASTADNPATTPDPCIISPDAKFRGEENQLYRVEIHTGGTLVTQNPKPATGGRRKKAQQRESTPDGPTFKWSRENGSVVFVVLDNTIPSLTNGTLTLSLANLGRDNSRFTLTPNDWVELFTPSSSLQQTPSQLLQVSKVDYTLMQVVLTPPKGTTTVSMPTSPFLLRRWDYRRGNPTQGGLTIASDGAAKIIEDTPLKLENGIVITFKPPSPPTDKPNTYRTGDYWLIPARTATGTILWPHNNNEFLPLPPKGITHHYAPLALITLADGGTIKKEENNIVSLRSNFKWLIELSQ